MSAVALLVEGNNSLFAFHDASTIFINDSALCNAASAHARARSQDQTDPDMLLTEWKRCGVFDFLGFVRGVAGSVLDHGETAMENKILPWMDSIAGNRPHILSLCIALTACQSTVMSTASGPWPVPGVAEDMCLPDRLKACARGGEGPSEDAVQEWKDKKLAAVQARPMDDEQMLLLEMHCATVIKNKPKYKKTTTEDQLAKQAKTSAKKFMRNRRTLEGNNTVCGLADIDQWTHTHKMTTAQGVAYEGTVGQKICRLVMEFAVGDDILAWRSIRKSEFCFMLGAKQCLGSRSLPRPAPPRPVS